MIRRLERHDSALRIGQPTIWLSGARCRRGRFRQTAPFSDRPEKKGFDVSGRAACPRIVTAARARRKNDTRTCTTTHDPCRAFTWAAPNASLTSRTLDSMLKGQSDSEKMSIEPTGSVRAWERVLMRRAGALAVQSEGAPLERNAEIFSIC